MDEDHHHHYGGAGGSNSNSTQTPMTDFRQFFSPIPTHHHHQQFPPPATIYSPAAAFPHHYDAMMLAMGGDGQDLSSAVATVPSSSSAGGGSASAFGLAGGDGGATARWPRQETLTLLEIRSRLDHKFKEANHKGPLWDEVSRIMCEEHGYQRSGKKCREKFENLYKYYKKTKEGKAGRQDGKHYRFFRQLEALYGDNSIHQHHHQIIVPTTTTTTATVSLSTSSDFSASTSDEVDAEKKGWKGKIKEFIESQMRKVMEKQESWLEKMMSSLEHREKERVMREEEWRKQEVMRMEREHRFWARERAWIEARDKALMDALGRITGKDVGAMLVNDDQRWEEEEMMKLVELRASVQDRFDECGGNGPRESCIWDEISSRMACLGHERSAKMCKEKWDFISKELEKKRISHHQEHHHYQHHQNTNLGWAHEQVLGPTQPQSTMNDSCMRILLGDGGGGGGGGSTSWESYGVKLNKGD